MRSSRRCPPRLPRPRRPIAPASRPASPTAPKTLGAAIASAVFAIALASTGSIEGATEAEAPLSGYLTVWAVWAVCAGAALLAALALVAAPQHAFSDTRTEQADETADVPS